MNIGDYRLKKAELLTQAPKYRVMCSICAQPNFGCFCSHVKPFDPNINFVILIHPIEFKRRIATGRMSHLTLQGSFLVKGQDYSDDVIVNHLVADPEYHSVILYPGLQSKNLSNLDEFEKNDLFPKNRKLRIFVIDGTWATARKMVRQSKNLKTLPRICFSPSTPSAFRVRKQPDANCYSTIEAIHQTIELIGQSQGFTINDRIHDRLMNVFDFMVQRQLDFIEEAQLNLRRASYRRNQQKMTGT